MEYISRSRGGGVRSRVRDRTGSSDVIASEDPRKLEERQSTAFPTLNPTTAAPTNSPTVISSCKGIPHSHPLVDIPPAVAC